MDEAQISQCIRNIVLNAREAMPEGGMISVIAENVEFKEPTDLLLPVGDYVKLSIADQGEGIPEDILPKIFDPYFSTRQRGDQKGMGLGLTICHSIIKKHGGAITVDLRPGSGTTFNIYLPAMLKKVQEKPVAQKNLPVFGRILVMDDEEMLRRLTGTLLRRLGYEIELAEDGEKAVALYQKAKELGRPFDGVILDLTVRGRMGGKAAIRELLKIDPAVKAIVSSGYDTDPVMQEYEKYGFKAALTKPYQISDLQRILTRVIGAGNL